MLHGEKRPLVRLGLAVGVVNPPCRAGLRNCVALTCLAQRRPQLLHKSRFPLGPRRHSGVLVVWQFAQSFCRSPAPLLRFRFFFATSSCCTSSASTRFLLSSCLSSYCQLELLVVFSSSNAFSSDARLSSCRPIGLALVPACDTIT